MKRFVFLLLAATWLISTTSCDKCRRVDCPDGDYKALLFFSKTDSTDLIEGGLYLLEQLEIVPILFDPTRPGARTRINLESRHALIWADNNTAGYIVRLDSLPPDTLLATVVQTADGDCCPGVTAFEALSLNGQPVPSDYTVCCIKIFK